MICGSQPKLHLYVHMHKCTEEKQESNPHMASISKSKPLVTRLCALCCYFALLMCGVDGRSVKPGGLKIKAVNLGGWLNTEGWIFPALFDGIVNKDLLDGTKVHLKSLTLGKYLSAELGGGSIIVANRSSPSGWETFKLWRINETTFNFRVFNNKFIGIDTAGNGAGMVAVATVPGSSESLTILRNPAGGQRVRIQAPNGLFLQAKTEDLVMADHSDSESRWDDGDPSVFHMTVVGNMHGEYQVTNGYGPNATKVMNEHWATYIVEDDFKFIASNGLNAVRIPIGWWIASDPNPPKPYVGGSLAALDRAFKWAEKYKLKVVIDLHAAPGSQNGDEHSSSRDGSLEWGQTDASIQTTVDVIEFLASRYSRSPSLYGVQLLNEPRAPGVTLEMLSKFYRAGYEAVRRHSSSAYVIMANRLGPHEETELFPLASGRTGSVVDIHYYNLFWAEVFNNMTVQQNIDFLKTNRSAQLSEVTTANGPPIFIGEWVAEWMVSGATKEDYRLFAEAQLEVWGRASFGWAYWTLKNVNNHWSLQWMINNGYITL
uniref:Mannan endo-1,4-beta-mannosidase n=1 Tax=Kalanchoe fedtschenkoi TaxID=63787 RepID=A0A7N1A8R5_KALFE